MSFLNYVNDTTENALSVILTYKSSTQSAGAVEYTDCILSLPYHTPVTLIISYCLMITKE